MSFVDPYKRAQELEDELERVEARYRKLMLACETLVGLALTQNDVALVRTSALRSLVEAMTE